jgi:hypothetical protein
LTAPLEMIAQVWYMPAKTSVTPEKPETATGANWSVVVPLPVSTG